MSRNTLDVAPVPTRLVGTAEHVCQIFDCFTESVPALTLTEVATRLGLRKSSVHRLLRTLVVHRYISVDPITRRYRLGDRLGNVARVYAASASVASLSRPTLEQLCLKTGETITLQTRVGGQRQIVAQFQSAQSVRVVLDERHRYPLDAGAAGHLLRAFGPGWRQERDHTKLARIRSAGFSVSRGELLEGALAIYVPVPNGEEDSAQFVLGLQAPAFRITDAKLKTILKQLNSAARALGETLPPDAPLGSPWA